MFTNNERRKLRFQTPNTLTTENNNTTNINSNTQNLQENSFERLNKARQQRRLEWEAEEEEARRKGIDNDFVGLCQEMCPEWERHEREIHLDVNKFERLLTTNSEITKIDHQLAIKKYHRPAAGNEAPLPEEVRPPHILKKTLHYLIDAILIIDSDFADRHKFIRDRTRAIRQDIIMQQRHINKNPILLEMVIEMHEEIARFHILSSHILSSQPLAIFDPFQNTEQLRKVLQSLMEFYSIHPSPLSEGEFRSYYMISHGRDESIFWQVESLSPTFNGLLNDDYNEKNDKRCSNRIFYQSVNILRDLHSRNWCSFVKGFKSSPYLSQCLLSSHLPIIREDVIRSLKKSHLTVPSSYIPFTVLKNFLMLECDDDDSKISQFLSYWGLVLMSDGKVFCTTSTEQQTQQTSSPPPPLPSITLKPSSNIVQNIIRGIPDAKDYSFLVKMMLDELLHSSIKNFLYFIAKKSIQEKKDLNFSLLFKRDCVKKVSNDLWNYIIKDILMLQCNEIFLHLKKKEELKIERKAIVSKILNEIVHEILDDNSLDLLLNYHVMDFDSVATSKNEDYGDRMATTIEVVGVDVNSLLERIQRELEMK